MIGYAIADGAPSVSELQVRRNYTNAVTKLGGKLMYEDRYAAFLRLEKGGSETWIEVRTSRSPTTRPTKAGRRTGGSRS